jgi:hypothetical protein
MVHDNITAVTAKDYIAKAGYITKWKTNLRGSNMDRSNLIEVGVVESKKCQFRK